MYIHIYIDYIDRVNSDSTFVSLTQGSFVQQPPVAVVRGGAQRGSRAWHLFMEIPRQPARVGEKAIRRGEKRRYIPSIKVDNHDSCSTSPTCVESVAGGSVTRCEFGIRNKRDTSTRNRPNLISETEGHSREYRSVREHLGYTVHLDLVASSRFPKDRIKFD